MPSEEKRESVAQIFEAYRQPTLISSSRKHGDRNEPKKETHRTMGYARVPLNPPTDFLKAHSLSSKKSEPRVSSRDPPSPKCKLDKRKPPVPRREEILEKEKEKAKNTKEEKNFRKMNKLEVQYQNPRQPVHKVVDSRDGHAQVIDRSGLEPIYLFKKTFGKKPAYIKEIKAQENERRNQIRDASASAKPTMHFVTGEEREKLLHGLKHNWAELQREFQMLPMLTDTVPKKKHKMKLENELRELEKDIDLLERNPEIYVCEDRNEKLTANSSSKYSGS